MWKTVFGILLIAGVGYVGYFAYDYYRGGFHTRPEMPDGAFSLSYKSGLRAILVDVPNERDTRRYFGNPMKVPFYLKEAWSFCNPPTKDEDLGFRATRKMMPGERFEAVCKINVDDDIVIRGVITSVPKL